MKYLIAILAVLILVGGGAYYVINKNQLADNTDTADKADETTFVPSDDIGDGKELVPAVTENTERPDQEVIGKSVAGHEIVAHHYGSGEKEVLFVGGIHSAFAPNTVAVAETLMEKLSSGEMVIPNNVTVTVIPNLNPDASGEPNTLAARLNTNKVDVNRNFDCDWSSTGVWRSTEVSGGTSAFSEPEAYSLRDYVMNNKIAAAVVYYAADGGVYASSCDGGLNTTTESLTNTYAVASGYTANKEFDAYKVSGDATNWLAKVGVPAIGVLLGDYTSTEWSKNEAGIKAVINEVAK